MISSGIFTKMRSCIWSAIAAIAFFMASIAARLQILNLLRDVDAEFEREDHRILSVLIEGDTIALRRLVELRHRGTSQAEQLVIAHLIRTRAGLIQEVFEYGDTATMRRLLRGA